MTYYDKEKQWEILKSWCKGLKQEAESKEDFQFRTFANEYSINEESTMNNYVIEWIRCAKEVKKNWTKYKTNNIRKFIITKRKSRKRKDNKKENVNDIKENW